MVCCLRVGVAGSVSRPCVLAHVGEGLGGDGQTMTKRAGHLGASSLRLLGESTFFPAPRFARHPLRARSVPRQVVRVCFVFGGRVYLSYLHRTSSWLLGVRGIPRRSSSASFLLRRLAAPCWTASWRPVAGGTLPPGLHQGGEHAWVVVCWALLTCCEPLPVRGLGWLRSRALALGREIGRESESESK